MTRRILIAAGLAAIALPAARTRSRARPTSRSRSRAVQVVDWKQDFTATTYDGGVPELTGGGRAEVHLHTPALQPVVARRLPNGTVMRVNLTRRGRARLRHARRLTATLVARFAPPAGAALQRKSRVRLIRWRA